MTLDKCVTSMFWEQLYFNVLTSFFVFNNFSTPGLCKIRGMLIALFVSFLFTHLKDNFVFFVFKVKVTYLNLRINFYSVDEHV